MTGAEDSDNQVVVHLPTWVRVLGAIFFLGCGAASYGLAQDIGKDTGSLVAFIISLFFTFLGIVFLGYTSKFIFDHTLGNMSIRTGVGPFIYRSRTFSKRQVLTCGVSTETSEATYTGGPWGGWPVTLWRVSLGISGRKKDLNIIVNNEKKADYLVDKIRAFVWSD